MMPGRGRVGFFAQSGALGVALLERARGRGHRPVHLRLRRQPGRRQRQRPAPVLGHRPRAPRWCCCYLESFGNPRKFARLARTGRPHQAGGRREERAARRHDPGPGRDVGRRCPSSRWRRCSPRPASSGSRPSRSCSTSARCWPTSRCPRATGWRSSATPRPSAYSSPTPSWRRGCGSRTRTGRHRRHGHAGAVPRRAAGRGRRRRRRRGRRGVPAAAHGGLGGVRAGAARGRAEARRSRSSRRSSSTEGIPAELAVLDERRHAGARLGAVVLARPSGR